MNLFTNTLEQIKIGLFFTILMIMTVGNAWGIGTTANDPYLISTAAEFKAFADGINSGTAFNYWKDQTKTIAKNGENQYFKLTTNIDLRYICNSTTNWIPIGTGMSGGTLISFNGHFNGAGHTISNLYIDGNSRLGLFGRVENATIDSVNLMNTYIRGYSEIGGLCAQITNTKISNIFNSGKISGSAYNIGGIVGSANELSTLINCVNAADVTLIEKDIQELSMGGICGYLNKSTISNSANSGMIIGGHIDEMSIVGIESVGGIVGHSTSYSTIKNNLNSGKVKGIYFVGGICGYVSEGENVITNNLSTNYVYADYLHFDNYYHTTQRVEGGICGLANKNKNTITNNYFDFQMASHAIGVGVINRYYDLGYFDGAATKNTTEMISLFSNDTNWVHYSNMYPIPKGIETNPIAIVAAAPLFLYEETYSSNKYGYVTSSFILGGSEKDVIWTVDDTNKVKIIDNNAFPIDTGSVTMVASKNNTIYKNIYLQIEKKASIITWNPPSFSTYGTKFSEFMNAVSKNNEIPGTFSYKKGTSTLSSTSILSVGSNEITVTFTPNNSDLYGYSSIKRTINVTKATPVITWANPTSITYGTALSYTQLNATANATGSFTYTPAKGTKLDAGTHTLKVTFTPSNTNYTTVTKTVSITVNKATSVITWANPTSITYGTALSNTQLNATANATGSFTYSPAIGTKLDAGTHTLTATFTPSNTTNYTTATKTVSITVKKATPIITWANPTSITYGTALSYTQLNATANATGSFTYSPAIGTKLDAGTHTLKATFTPSSSTNYSTVEKEVSIIVNKATPVITWANPTSITYGTALSYTQLNATANATGSFTYSPAIGTKLDAGTHTLKATFTPSNTNYSTVEKEISIIVDKATPVITWDDPTSITYGTELSDTELNATSDVEGSIEYSPISGTKLDAGTHTLTATFTPSSTNYSTVEKEVSIIVNKATPVITWDDPTSITYGTELSDTELNATSDVEGSFEYSPIAGTKLDIGTHTLTATFTPSNTTNYTTATKMVSIIVDKATPVITWNDPTSITYGTELSDTELNATSDVEGSFEYSPIAGTKLDAGTHTLTATFTPSNSTYYTTATKKVSITVNKATPVITWNDPTSITYGTELSDTELNATSDVEGSIEYSPISGTKLDAGTHTLKATFTPSNTNYSTVEKEVSITVKKVTPVITWDDPTSITYGTALSKTQLNATSDVEGSFEYSPKSGTKLDAGTHTLTVVFTPSDTTNYKASETSVEIKVLKSTGIAQTKQGNFNLYPNITTTGFYIDLNDGHSAISIYDHKGRIMQHVNVSGKEYIDITQYAQGIYIVKTSQGKIWKVIKQ